MGLDRRDRPDRSRPSDSAAYEPADSYDSMRVITSSVNIPMSVRISAKILDQDDIAVGASAQLFSESPSPE